MMPFWTKLINVNSRSSLLASLLGLFMLYAPSTAAQIEMPPGADVTALQQAMKRSQWIMQQLQKIGATPGLTFSVGYRDRILFATAWGKADVAGVLPTSADHLYRYSDASSLFTAIAIMQLVETGKVGLDNDVRDYLTNFPRKEHSFTIRQLLNHTAGITGYTHLDLDRGLQHTNNLAASIKRFMHRPLAYEPGTRYLYTNYGYTLLGAVIETVTNKPFMQYLREEIINPAGITSVLPENMDKPPEMLVKFYDRGGSKFQESAHRDLSYALPGAGLNGTAQDLVRLASALWSGKLLSPPMFAQMLTPEQLNSGQTIGTADYQMGLGWRIDKRFDGKYMIFHGGLTVGASSAVMSLPEVGLHLSYLTNTRWESYPQKTLASISFGLTQALQGKSKFSTCPVGTYRHYGKFSKDKISGKAQIFMKDGECQGTIVTPSAMLSWAENHSLPPVNELPFIYIGDLDDTPYFALLTPFGAHPMTLEGTGDRRRAKVEFDSIREWEFTLVPTP